MKVWELDEAAPATGRDEFGRSWGGNCVSAQRLLQSYGLFIFVFI